MSVQSVDVDDFSAMSIGAALTAPLTVSATTPTAIDTRLIAHQNLFACI